MLMLLLVIPVLASDYFCGRIRSCMMKSHHSQLQSCPIIACVTRLGGRNKHDSLRVDRPMENRTVFWRQKRPKSSPQPKMRKALTVLLFSDEGRTPSLEIIMRQAEVDKFSFFFLPSDSSLPNSSSIIRFSATYASLVLPIFSPKWPTDFCVMFVENYFCSSGSPRIHPICCSMLHFNMKISFQKRRTEKFGRTEGML